MSENNQKPWLAKDGSLLPDEVLSLLSQNWSQETWDEYFETFEPKLKEKLGVSIDICTYAEQTILAEREITEESDGDPRYVLLDQAISRLTPSEQKVIRLYYWEDLTETKIGARLRITRSSVHTLKGRAIVKLREFLSPFLPILQRDRSHRFKETDSYEAETIPFSSKSFVA